EAHCFEVERRYDMQVSFRSEGELVEIPWDTTLCLFRIAQEGLRNAAKHANARRLTVSIAGQRGEVALTMTDDGQGFDLALARQDGSGLGLVSMEERAHLVGGAVNIVTRKGEGTIIRVRVPLRGALAPESDAPPERTQAFIDTLAPVQSPGGVI